VRSRSFAIPHLVFEQASPEKDVPGRITPYSGRPSPVQQRGDLVPVTPGTLFGMNEITPSGQSEPSPARPERPALSGAVRRQLQELFPDLDPDVVSQVLGITDSDEEGEK
jgi:hypothetical protein